jgi:uncharacterized membrane protein (UPF0182 family)
LVNVNQDIDNYGELVLCVTPHGTALDGTNFIKDLWNKETEAPILNLYES